ncbi:MAG: hypothetical protein ACFFDI_05615 [Promethearchaeota archaeon]
MSLKNHIVKNNLSKGYQQENIIKKEALLKNIMTVLPICPCFDGEGCIKYFDCEPYAAEIMPQLRMGEGGALYCIADVLNEAGEEPILRTEKELEGYLVVMKFLLKYKNQEQMQNELNIRSQQAKKEAIRNHEPFDEWEVRNEWFITITQRSIPEILDYVHYKNELKMEWLTCACLYKTLLSIEKKELTLAEGDMAKVEILLHRLRELRDIHITSRT